VKILRNEVVAKKLKQITWDRMEVHLKAINGLKNNFIVFNYQVRKVSPQDKRRLQLVFDLRRAQRKEARRRGGEGYEFYSNRNVVNGGVVQPLILGGEKREERKEEKGGKKKKEEEGAERAEAAEEVFNEEEWGLLYSAFELYCDNAKRNQIAMMRHLMLRIKETYNREFEKTLKLRQNQNELINDKNKRIQEICEELKRPNEALSGKRNLLETNDHVLAVAPNDIPFPKYLSREEREKAERERLKEEERQRKLAEDDASQRALAKMMGGTLEERKTSVLEVTVEREKWMEKPVEEMSEEEKAKLKEYEVRRQKAEEEKERIVKKLEAELRKLRAEIDDIMEKYDEKLFSLLKRKLEYDYRIEEQELYCTRLHLRIAALASHHGRHEALLLRAEAHRAQLAQLAAHRAQLGAQEQELEHAREAKHAALDAKKLGDIESKIKTIEKTIFEEYATNFKKRREMEEKLLDSDPAARSALLPLDPLRDIESRLLANDKARDFHFFTAEIKVLQQTYDIPEHSLMQILESRFNIRREEAELDAKLKTLKDTLGVLEEKQSAGEAEVGRYE
jgi:hypothetical protein